MLQYELLKNHAGLLLCGDYSSLRLLHDVVHEVNESSILIKDKEGVFLSLAYDVRKAYEGQRRVLPPPDGYPEVGKAYGVELLWPVALLQCSILRSSLAFFDSTKRQQGVTFLLEDIMESALRADFGLQAEAILEQWQRIDPRHPWAEEKINGRGAQFCAWNKTQRKNGLSGLLASLDPMYPTFYPIWVRNGVANLISPETLDALAGAEWDDPRW